MEFENCIEEQRENDEDVGTEEELIELVKACPILYDVRLKVYKDRNMKESAWRSISDAMKLSALECKNKWKNIRDAYVKFLHAMKESNITGKKVKKRYKYADKMTFLDRCIQHRNPPGNYLQRSTRDSTPQNNSVSMVVTYNEDSRVEMEQLKDEPPVASPIVTNSTPVVIPPEKPSPINVQPVATPKANTRSEVVEEKRGKKRKLETEKNSDSPQQAAFVNEQDDSKLFCLSLISTLKRLSPRKRQLAKLRIQNVLFDIEFSESTES